MANTFNKLIGIFRLGKDPEIRYTPGGVAIANMTCASEHSFKKNEQWEKETEWSRMVAFGKTAERIGEYLSKGSLVYIEGRLKTNIWEDKDGKKNYTTEVVILTINFLEKWGKERDGDHPPKQQEPQRQQTQRQERSPKNPYDDSDIPF